MRPLLVSVLQQVEAVIGRPVPKDNIINVHDVRNVAPGKEMMCVSFRYPPPVPADAPSEESDGRSSKRQRIEFEE